MIFRLLQPLLSILCVSLASSHFAAFWPAATRAAEPLPVAIPVRVVGSAKLIEEAAATLSRHVELRERYLATSNCLYYLYLFSPEELKPLIELLERDAPQVQDEALHSSTRGILIHFAPDLALELFQNVADQRRRDHWLGEIAVAAARRDMPEARSILERVKDPFARAKTLVEIAQYGKVDFEETKAALTEARRLGWPDRPITQPYIYGTAVGRFASEHFQDSVEFVRSALSPQESVTALCGMARVCRSERKEAEIANSLLSVAADLISTCEDPFEATRTLFTYGFAEQDSQRAREFLDTYWRDRVLPPELAEVLFTLAGTDIGTAARNAEEIADRYKLSKEKMVVGVLARIARGQGPVPVLTWLEEAPASPLRDATVAPIISGLSSFAARQRLNSGQVQSWLQGLGRHALAVANNRQRWMACDAVCRLCEQASLSIPNSIHDERSRLLFEVESQLLPGYLRFELYPHERQRAAIDRTWQQGHEEARTWDINGIRSTAALVRDSTLPPAEKRAWFEKLLHEARAILNLKDRSAVLSGLGLALGKFDPEWSIRVHWEGLGLARQLGLKPEYHDVGDSLGTVFHLATADEALRRASFDGSDANVNALWAFARQLENADDRSAVLEALSKALVQSKDYERAAGVAALIDSPLRRACLAAHLAAAQSGKTRPN